MKHDVVVIGGSAGSVTAVQALAAGLPGDLPAAVLVTLHVGSERHSWLPKILAQAGTLPCAHAQDGEPLRQGQIYVAPPGRHLLVQRDVVHLSQGPRVNRTRPAIDPLFRSAAAAYGPHVVGVVLTGLLDDGSQGLAVIKAQGGVALVQDPEEAAFESMPRAAIAACHVDAVLPVSDLAAYITRLARGTYPSEAAQEGKAMEARTGLEQNEAAVQQIAADLEAQVGGQPRSGCGSTYSCPECGGVLWQLSESGLVRFQCHTGHAYSPRTLLAEKSRALEMSLWTSVRLLTEKRILTRQLAEILTAPDQEQMRGEILAMADLDAENREALLAMLEAYPNVVGQDVLVEQALDEASVSSQRDEKETGS